MTIVIIFSAALCIISLVAFIMYGLDKKKAPAKKIEKNSEGAVV